MEKKILINKVKNRILFLSPSVREGLEKECCKEDFFSEGDKAIGKGGFGQVWKVRHKITDKIYVIKVMNKQNIIDQKMVEQINREIEIMYKLNHPHIIKLYNHFEDDYNLYLIMHFASKGQLYSLLKKQGRFDQRTTAQYMREVISAVKYIHSFDPPIIHRDIKPENILLDENGRVKLADFGWSNYVNKNKDLRRTYCGTPEYLAPEMIKKEGHDTSIDIWDLGVLMFELLCGKPPFGGSTQGELFSNIKKHRINWPDDFPPLAKNLICKILKQKPKERLSLDAIIKHSWFETNPPLRPVLVADKVDERQWLESHIINPKNENTKEVINNILKNKRKSIVEMIRKINIISSQNQNKTANNQPEEKVIPEEKDPSPLVVQLNEVVEKYKKENWELKKKNDKIEVEIKSLKNELAKLKDPNAITQDKLQMQSLKEELEKYKIQNKDRLGLLNEIEEKTKEIMDLKMKLKESENEIETMKRNNISLNKKYSEEKAQNQVLYAKLNEVKNENTAIIKKKDETIAEYSKKMAIFKEKFLNENDSEDSQTKSQNLLKLVIESVNEFKELFQRKTENWQVYMNDSKNDLLITEKKISEMLVSNNESVIDAIQKFKNIFDENYMKISQKIGNDPSSNVNKRLDWQQKHITELMVFKNKSAELKVQVAGYEEKMKLKEEALDIEKEKLKTVQVLVNQKENIINKDKKYITHLEARLGDVKDFIIRHFPEKLEEFNQWFYFDKKNS